MNSFKIILIIILVCPCLSFSQAVTLDRSQSGAALVYGYSDAENGSVQTGSFINTAKGIFDIGITLGSINPDGFGDNLSLIGIQGEIYPIRESDSSGGFPFSFSVLGVWTNTGPNNTTGYGYGASVFKRLNFADDAFIAPVFAIGKLWPLGNDYPSENVITLDLALVVSLNPKLRMHATPSMAWSDSEEVTGIFFGLSFMGAKKLNKRN